MCVRMGSNNEEWSKVLHMDTADGVPIYFIEHHAFFDRSGLYHDEAMHDYHDNPRRFAFLCRAALQYCMDVHFRPDIVHAHDWHTALLPAYLKIWFWDHPYLGHAASVLTVHNAAHQGVYPHGQYGYFGLGEQAFTPECFESWGQVNILKGGIAYSDMVNTVSPGYAREITTPHGGFGLAPYFTAKGDAFCGVLNGVDYASWCPEQDPIIPAKFSVQDMAGKAECKRALQKAFKLDLRDDVPIVGAIGRFVTQKGYHLVRGTIEELLWDVPMQFVILGSGDWENTSYFGMLPGRCPGRAGSYIGYSEEVAHLIEAGSDFFLMPSMFEPCGLNQLYSLRYGTLPIVHATGGLDDTVEQYNEQTGQGTGFKFHAPTQHALYNTVRWAVSTWHDRKAHMKMMIERAMQRDFSWEHAVLDYEALYQKAIQKKAEYDRSHS
jgi:starch synthase